MTFAIGLSIGLFLGIILCLDAGFRLGNRKSNQNSEHSHEGIGVIEAAVFALLGLLLGFSFANGMSHLDEHRQQIVQKRTRSAQRIFVST